MINFYPKVVKVEESQNYLFWSLVIKLAEEKGKEA